MQFSQLPNQLEQNFDPSLKDQFMLKYDETNTENPKLHIFVADSKETWINYEKKVQLPRNEWIFVAFTVDYEIEQFKFYYYFQQNG